VEIKREKVNKNKKWKIIERKRLNKKGRVLYTFHSNVHLTKSGEAVLPNVLVKGLQLPHKIRSTSTATAGADTATAEALPKAP
jgi:hypothetical protein